MKKEDGSIIPKGLYVGSNPTLFFFRVIYKRYYEERLGKYKNLIENSKDD